jgi:ABC-2 type transport system permease protein
VVLLEWLFVGLASAFSEEIKHLWLSVKILQSLLPALLGAEIPAGGSFTTAFLTVGYGHPVLYALVWAFVLTTCSRLVAGEIERGTADLLLTLPVSRARVYVSVSAVWAAAGIVICASTLAGTRLGHATFTVDEAPGFGRLAIVVLNLWLLYLATGCATLCVSSWTSRRGPAIGWVLAVLIASFLLNFLAQFWSAAKDLKWLGVLHYYRPLPIVMEEGWPARDLAVLGGLSVVLWVAGLWRFVRRDIPAA